MILEVEAEGLFFLLVMKVTGKQKPTEWQGTVSGWCVNFLIVCVLLCSYAHKQLTPLVGLYILPSLVHCVMISTWLALQVNLVLFIEQVLNTRSL